MRVLIIMFCPWAATRHGLRDDSVCSFDRIRKRDGRMDGRVSAPYIYIYHDMRRAVVIDGTRYSAYLRRSALTLILTHKTYPNLPKFNHLFSGR